MLPFPRSRSRQSTSSTTPDLDSLDSWSHPTPYISRSMAPRGSASTVTSIWSDADDGATVLPSSEEGVWGQRGGYKEDHREKRGAVVDAPLIELDSDYEAQPARQGGAGKTGPTPADALKRLLAQMEGDAKAATPADPFAIGTSPIRRPTSLPPTQPAARARSPPLAAEGGYRRANWREGRRIGVYPPTREAGDSSLERASAGEEEEESPPTPPVRITNPYRHSARKTSGMLPDSPT